MELTQEHLELIIDNNLKIKALIEEREEEKKTITKMKDFMSNANGERERSCPRNIKKDLQKQVTTWSVGITGGALGIILAVLTILKVI